MLDKSHMLWFEKTSMDKSVRDAPCCILKFHRSCHEHDPWKLRSRHRDDLDISGIQGDKNLTKIARLSKNPKNTILRALGDL